MHLLPLHVCVFELNADGLLVGGLDIEALDERLDFEADGGEVLLQRVLDVEGLVGGDEVGRTCEGGVAEFHILTSGGNEVDFQALPLVGVG